MPLKLSSSISLVRTISHTTITSSKPRNSSLHLSLIFSVFHSLVIFLGRITLLPFLNKFPRGWGFCCALVIFLCQSSCFLFIGEFFSLVRSTPHTSEVVPLTQFSLTRWSL